MNVLIVESNVDLGTLWLRHLQRQGLAVKLVASGTEATDLLEAEFFDVIVLDLVLKQGSAFAVADFARYKRPETNVIFVTDTTFFSDGSIFSLMPNARAFLESHTPPEDLVAMVEHFGTHPGNADGGSSGPIPPKGSPQRPPRDR